MKGNGPRNFILFYFIRDQNRNANRKIMVASKNKNLRFAAGGRKRNGGGNKRQENTAAIIFLCF